MTGKVETKQDITIRKKFLRIVSIASRLEKKIKARNTPIGSQDYHSL